jgi:HAD superfamily hydrolase (TIGR01549 family)
VQVLTFDFHNTLANCDPWFELEVRELPWAVLVQLDVAAGAAHKHRLDTAYRQLRLDVIASGNEIDAYDSVMRVFDETGISASRRDVVTRVNCLMEAAIEHMEPVPGAADTVNQLHAAGIRLGVVSSAVHHETLEWILGRMGIADRFDTITTSASSGYYKSTPAIYAHALQSLGGDAGASVHIGDSLKWDVEVSQQAGMRGVWLQTGRREVFAADVENARPALVLSSMEDAAPSLLTLLRDSHA